MKEAAHTCGHMVTLMVHAANVEDEFLACTTGADGKYFLTTMTNAKDEFVTAVLAKHITSSGYATTKNSKDLEAFLLDRKECNQRAHDTAFLANVEAAHARDKKTTTQGQHADALLATYKASVATSSRLPLTSPEQKMDIGAAVAVVSAAWATKLDKSKQKPAKSYEARIKEGSMPLTVAEKLLRKVWMCGSTV